MSLSKSRKRILVAVGSLIAVVLVAVVLLFTPAIQRRIFLTAVAAPGRAVAVERLVVTLDGLDVSGLRWSEAGSVVSVREMRLKLPLLAVARGKPIEVEELSIGGIKAVLAAEPAAQGSAGSDSAAADPVRSDDAPVLKLPREVIVRRLVLDGEVTLPPANTSRPTLVFTIEVGGFAPGAEGSVKWAGTFRDPGIAALAAGESFSGELKVRQTSALEIDRIFVRAMAGFLTGELSATLPEGRLADASADGAFSTGLARLFAFVPAEFRPAGPVDGAVHGTLHVVQGAGGSMDLESHAEVVDLAGAVDGKPVRIPRITIDAATRGVPGAAMTLEIAAAVVGTQSEDVSDVRIHGGVDLSLPVVRTDLELTSRRISVPTLQQVQAVLAAPVDEAPVPSPAGQSPGAPTETGGPPWSGVEGDIRMALALVMLPDGGSAREIGGAVHLEAGALKIQGLKGVFLDAPFSGDVVLTYAADTRKYALGADMAFENLDAGRALKTLQPDRTPDIEGVFQAKTRVTSTATDLASLAEGIQGELTLRGGKGVFRGLRQKTGGALSLAAGLVGAFTRSRTVQTVADMAAALETVQYDDVALQASLTQGNLLRVTDISLRSPDIALRGAGSLTLVNDGSWLDWLKAPMALELNLGGKGRVGRWLAELGTAAQEPDALGYTTLKKPFKMGGSVSSPDSSDLWTTLGKAAASLGTQLLQPGGAGRNSGSGGGSPDKAP